MIVYAKIQQHDLLEVCIDGGLIPPVSAFSIIPGLEIHQFRQEHNRFFLTTEPFDCSRSYRLQVKGHGEKQIQPDGILDLFYSSSTLGHSQENGLHCFRLFAPRAIWVKLVLFRSVNDHCDQQILMKRDKDGVWETVLESLEKYLYYGYCVAGPDDETELFEPSLVLADPYSKAVVTQNHFLHPSKTLLYPPLEFDWEGDTWISLPKEDLIIYEMHIRDMTMHESAGIPAPYKGTYLGLTRETEESGLGHILKLGVNCVELLPVQEFGNIEIDYKSHALDIYNDWNAYERNHWGYMPSCYFAPESYYATEASLELQQYIGQDGRAVTELKTMIKALHRHGIAVIMDVVYNHVSQYDLNPLKYTDKKYYLRLDNNQNLISESGCGNDFRTERPMARELITESLLYWMEAYHIDGFRFDLATMIDHETLSELTKALREVNPDVILIAEPWGGGRYDLQGFSRLGWGAWNDLFRNGIKGQNPHDGLGVIFGNFWNGQQIEHIRNYISGSVQSGGGPFLQASHSVNYLESHDDYSLGDFIRIGLREVDPSKPVKNIKTHAVLSEMQLKISRLAALFLMTSQGAVMLHAGQEFGRSKVIAPNKKPGTYPGFIDHNSYNKDDETNWINYDHVKLNQPLMDYYAGLIAIRKKYESLRRTADGKPVFLTTPDPLLFAFQVGESDGTKILVVLNCHRTNAFTMSMPQGPWELLADENRASAEPFRHSSSDTLTVKPGTGRILIHR